MGPPGLVEKKPLYVQLMKEGHSNRAACKILGINPNTGHRWLHGRNGVEGLVQQGLDPRPREAVPATGGSSRYLCAQKMAQKRRPRLRLAKLAGDEELRQ
jgi:IS30 family transposase